MEDLSTLISDLDGLGLKSTLVRGKDFGWMIDGELANDPPSKKWGRLNLRITKEAANLLQRKFGLRTHSDVPWKLPVSSKLEVRLFSERFNKGKPVGNIEFWFIGDVRFKKFHQAVCICWSLSGDRVLWATAYNVSNVLGLAPGAALSNRDGELDRKLKDVEVLSHRRMRTVERELASILGSIILEE